LIKAKMTGDRSFTLLVETGAARHEARRPVIISSRAKDFIWNRCLTGRASAAGALKKDSFLNLRVPPASNAC